MKIVISSGHGKHIRGAAGPKPWGLDEVDEARKVVEQTAMALRNMGVEVMTYHDDVSTSQNENLNRIVDFHNSKTRDLDVSVHFNCYDQTAHGCEVLYVSSTGKMIADAVVDSVCSATPLTNRGPKKRTDLFFLNNTEQVAVLVETAFCDNKGDCDIYRAQFNDICAAIASALAGEEVGPAPEPPPDEALLHVNGRCSWFGGPNDTGVAPDEGLAFLYEVEDAPQLFLPTQPPGTTGLARRLDPDVFYVACRFDYSVTSKTMLADPELQAIVRANGRELRAWPADWGPNQNTGRVADISPGLMAALGIDTDDNVEVVYPAPAIEPAPPEPVETAIVEIKTTGNVQIIVNGQPITV